MSNTLKHEFKVIIHGAIVVAIAILLLKVGLPYAIDNLLPFWRFKYNYYIEGVAFIFGSLIIVAIAVYSFLRFLGNPLKQGGHLKAELLDAEEALESAIDAEEVAEASERIKEIKNSLQEFDGGE